MIFKHSRFGIDLDLHPVRQRVPLFEVLVVRRHLTFKVYGAVAEVLFYVPQDVLVLWRVEGVPAAVQQLYQTFGYGQPADRHAPHGVQQREPFVNRHDFRVFVPGIHHQASGRAAGVQCERRLGHRPRAGYVEQLKHNLWRTAEHRSLDRRFGRTDCQLM